MYVHVHLAPLPCTQGLTRYISTTAPAAAADTAPDDVGAELDGLVLCGEKGALRCVTSCCVGWCMHCVIV